MPQILLLGLAQDGGFPQTGCFCHNCTHFPPRNVISLAIIHNTDVWLLDASPDIKPQLAMLHKHVPGFTLKGICLTHLHMGHYTGLLQLGKEVMNTKQLPVYGSARVCDWLKQNGPWDIYVQDQNITLNVIEPEQPVSLAEGLSVVPFHVPHREDISDTFAYIVQGQHKSLLFCPDTDGWAAWSPSLAVRLNTVDVALLDATFFSADELPGRDLKTIAHPMVTETVEYIQKLLKEHAQQAGDDSTQEGLSEGGPVTHASSEEGWVRVDKVGHIRCKEFVLVHLNHSNPLYDQKGWQWSWVEERGVRVGVQGEVWEL